MSGYIGTQPVPQATQTRDVFTATSGQTTFATSGYTPNFLDVWLNGVKLVNGDDFTATNGSDVVLTTGAAAGDTVEVLSYSTYEVNAQTYTGGLTVNNDAATVLTVDRATSDGTLVDFKKDGTSVGSVGTQGGDKLTVGNAAVGVAFNNTLGVESIYPWNLTTNDARDAAVDIGYPTVRFKDLYLSGGVYLGGTGAANLLDDYEEGTFSLSPSTSGYTLSINEGYYTKIGREVTVQYFCSFTAVSTYNSACVFTGMPFVSANLKSGTCQSGVARENSTTGALYVANVQNNNTTFEINSMDGIGAGQQRTLRVNEVYCATLTYVTS